MVFSIIDCVTSNYSTSYFNYFSLRNRELNNGTRTHQKKRRQRRKLCFGVISCESNLTSLWTLDKERNVSASCCNIHIYSYLITNESGPWNLQSSWLYYKPLSSPHFIIIKELKCTRFCLLTREEGHISHIKSFQKVIFILSWDQTIFLMWILYATYHKAILSVSHFTVILYKYQPYFIKDKLLFLLNPDITLHEPLPYTDIGIHGLLCYTHTHILYVYVLYYCIIIYFWFCLYSMSIYV